jgi:nucleoside-diphosphate-sugar epimerase
MSINLFGGSGFVGSEFQKRYQCVVNERNDLVPKKAHDVLYLISTVDNYNVYTNPYVDIETNLTTLIRVLENYRLNASDESTTFNFASSWFVYGDTTLPANEDAQCDPKGFYSITKRTAEQLLISYCETYNLNYRILRFANVIGPGDKKVSKKKNALTYLLNEVMKNGEINLYEGGEFYRDFIHVSDLCSAVKLVMEKGKKNEIYNVGNGKLIKFKDIIDYAIKKTNSTVKVNFIEQPQFHKMVQVKSMCMDNTKLRSLGYIPTYTINNIVDQILS